MDRNNALALYLIGTLGQIWIICTITFILRNYGIRVDFTTPIGVIAIGVGGTSSALWGIIIIHSNQFWKNGSAIFYQL